VPYRASRGVSTASSNGQRFAAVFLASRSTGLVEEPVVREVAIFGPELSAAVGVDAALVRRRQQIAR
jgi:hypothetical protein